MPRVTLSPPSIDFVVAVLRRHVGLIVACTAVTFTAVLGALVWAGPTYEVSASLLVKLGREMAPPTTVSNDALAVQTKRPEDIASETAIMQSPDLLAGVVAHFGEDFFLAEPVPRTAFQRVKAVLRAGVKRVKATGREALIALGLRRRLTPTEQVVVALQQALVVEPVRRSDIVQITLRTSDPEAGVQVVSTLIDLYLARHIAAFTTPRAREFFEQQADDFRRRLEETEQTRARFQLSNSAWDLGEQRRLLLAQQRELAGTRDATVADIARLETEIGETRKKLANLPRDLRVSLEQESKLEGLRARVATQGRQLGSVAAELRKLDGMNAELHRLDREIALLEQNYLLYSKHLEEARISKAMDQAEIANVALVAPPSSTMVPVRPRLAIWLVGSLMLGAGAPIALVFAREALRPTVRTREEIVEILDSPVLAALPDGRRA